MPYARARFCGTMGFVLCLFTSIESHAQITVDGLTDKTVYADSVSFEVQVAAGFDTTADLDGDPVAVGTPVTVTEVDYHQLSVRRVNQSTQAEETRVLAFIIRSSERENSEWGLPPWIPYPMIPSAAAEFTGARLEITMPQNYPQALEIPIVAWVLDTEGNRVGVNGLVRASEFPEHSLQLLRGVGSAYLPAASAPATLSYTARIQGLEASRSIAIDTTTNWQDASGTLATATTWGEDSRIRVTSTVTVPSGVALSIGAGCVVQMAPGADLIVNGSLIANGTQTRPIVFAPASRNAPWGGFTIRGSAATVQLTRVIAFAGCADQQWFSNNPGSGGTHLPQQAMLYVSGGAHVTLTDTALLDSHGQGGHGEASYFTWTRSLMQRFLTGGEYNGCIMDISHSAIIEFPSESEPFADDDGDAIYFTGGTTIPSLYTVTDTLIGWAHDDGIDSGSGSGGTVKVERCWVEGDFHEGLAWSADSGVRRPDIKDTVTLNCGQGIEAGWGDVQALVTRCFSTGNATGIRFGDNYDWDYEGSLQVTDSIILHNYRDVWGRAWDDWTEHLSQMDIRENLLTRADPLHPLNQAWDPAADASRLEPFLPTPAGPVGVGIATRAAQLDLARVQDGIPVRLSSFSVLEVRVDWTCVTEDGPAGSGTLVFEPGETVKTIVPDPALVSGKGLLRATLRNPVNAEITGLSEVEYIERVEVVLLAAGSVWKFFDSGSAPTAGWKESGFDDAAWESGPAALGFGDDQETPVDGGPSTNRTPAVYFRTGFEVAADASFESVSIRLRRDDGAVVYLNGAEVFRSNMPTGEIVHTTWASDSASGSEETAFFTGNVDPAAIVAGTNTLAVELHQSDATSSDLSFDMALTGIAEPTLGPSRFLRGDANGDAGLDISDAVKTLLYLFIGDTADCTDAMDTDDSGDLNVTDVISLLNFLFLSGPAPREPYPEVGADPSEDGLECTR